MDGKRVLVTGASSGIGAELARQLGARGARLAVSARSVDRLKALADEVHSNGGRRPIVIPTDLSRRGEAAELATRAVDALTRIDVLVNNAGLTMQGLQWRAGDADIARAIFETDYWSPLALTQALVPAMRERHDGAVVNVTSMIQVSPFPGLGHICSAKAALAIATQTLRMELRGSGVRVIEVPLGVIDTPGSHEQTRLPGGEKWLRSGPTGTPAGAAKAIISALEGRRDRVIYPRQLAPGYMLPGLARMFAARYAREADPEFAEVRLGGSQGDEYSRRAREEWERKTAAGSAGS
jgi:short-subunit dehydrogenase